MDTNFEIVKTAIAPRESAVETMMRRIEQNKVITETMTVATKSLRTRFSTVTVNSRQLMRSMRRWRMRPSKRNLVWWKSDFGVEREREQW